MSTTNFVTYRKLRKVLGHVLWLSDHRGTTCEWANCWVPCDETWKPTEFLRDHGSTRELRSVFFELLSAKHGGYRESLPIELVLALSRYNVNVELLARDCGFDDPV
jgi:hypothetical protein